MRRALAVLVLAAQAVLAAAAPAAAESAVRAAWRGYETVCAEFDNAVFALEGPTVRSFEIVASHPAYLAGWRGDSMAPDFTGCVFPDRPDFTFSDPFDKVLYEDDRILLKGLRYEKSWRPEQPPFFVGDVRFDGVQLTQLHVKLDGRPVEVLVLYPVDGYWRPRPLPPVDRAETGFGSSFLIGPVSEDVRPFVRLSEVRFDPATLTYRLGFVRGGGASVRLVAAGRRETRLAVTLDAPLRNGAFALLSSMHVTPDNADLSRVGVRTADQALWRDLPVAGFTEATGAEFAFGRDLPSRHNYSAPDVTFGRFGE